MSQSLKKRRCISREANRQLTVKNETALQFRRLESLPYLAVVDALSYPCIGQLVAEYATSSTTTVLITGLGKVVVPMGERHIATLVHELLARFIAREALCGLPLFRYTCNGRDISDSLQSNPDLNLGDLSNCAPVTEFVRHIRHRQ
jgi:hypothetical protein